MPPKKDKMIKAVSNSVCLKERKKRSSQIINKSRLKNEKHSLKRKEKSNSKNEPAFKKLSTANAPVSNCLDSGNRLTDSFFDIPCISLSQQLLGKILVRKHKDGTLMKGRIVETECYAGGDDKASCSYGGKITPKNKPTFMKPGTAYVYMTYGMYHCINISSQGDGAAVLLRALEPIKGIDKITESRQNFGNKKDPQKLKEFKLTELCNGPSKLCIGFNIDKNTVNEKDLCSWSDMWVERDGNCPDDIGEKHIVKSKRIGIDLVGEPWVSKPLRFYIYESSTYASKRDKKSEESVKQNLSILN